MRITAGSARGRTLLGPKKDGIRPTSDKVRQAVFNLLGQRFEGERVLDLFAGTGAMALEAISRGASLAVVVDSSHEAVRLCRINAGSLGFSDRVVILDRSVAAAVSDLTGRGEKFERVFADPPYARFEPEPLLKLVEPILASDGTLCLEHDRRVPVPSESGRLSLSDQRRFGDTQISIYRFLDLPSRLVEHSR